VPDARCRVDHGDLAPEWHVAGLSGARVPARPDGSVRLATRLGPFVTDLQATGRTGGPGEADPDAALHVALTACQVLGTLDRAVELTADHVSTRVQFGKPISAFQAVQFQLADAHVAVAGLRELAHFTLWRLAGAPNAALVDALALRLHAIDVARGVLRTCQQLHGAAGVCDEYDISVLARHVQPALRLPWSGERTAAELAGAIQRDGFDGLFAHGGAQR
jgi:acyl-CoA dehydrogenase